MAAPFSPTSRQERLIGAGRVVLAASSLLAVQTAIEELRASLARFLDKD